MSLGSLSNEDNDGGVNCLLKSEFALFQNSSLLFHCRSIYKRLVNFSAVAWKLIYLLHKSVPFTEKRLRKSENGIKEKCKEVKTSSRSVEHSDWENRTTLSDFPLLREIFHWNDPQSQSDCKDPTSDCKIDEINDDIFSLGKFNLS